MKIPCIFLLCQQLESEVSKLITGLDITHHAAEHQAVRGIGECGSGCVAMGNGSINVFERREQRENRIGEIECCADTVNNLEGCQVARV